jgi:hypothetical protein
MARMHALLRSLSPSRRAFALPWACGAVVIAAAAIAFIAMLIAVGVRGGSDPYAISRAMGAMAAVLLIAALIGGITTSSRTRRAPGSARRSPR